MVDKLLLGQDMSITMTVMKEGEDCQFFADKFLERDMVRTANPVTYCSRTAFGTYTGPPMLSLPLEDAKKMAQEILDL